MIRNANYAQEPEAMLSRIYSCVLKFIGCAFFGGLVSLILFVGTLSFIEGNWFWSSKWVNVFWIIPVAFGFFGMVWFEKVLDAGKWLMEEMLGLDRE
jgi:hypothetical protein